MKLELLIFVIAFVAPVLFWRVLFWLAREKFDKPFTRTKTGLQVHHGHFGLLIILIASILVVLGLRNFYVFGFLGLGLGLVFDEFIPSLLMPGNRELELETYKKSLRGTLALVLITVLVVLFFIAN